MNVNVYIMCYTAKKVLGMETNMAAKAIRPLGNNGTANNDKSTEVESKNRNGDEEIQEERSNQRILRPFPVEPLALTSLEKKLHNLPLLIVPLFLRGH